MNMHEHHRSLRTWPWRTFLHNYWPILALLGLTALFAIANYIPGTTLIGWDNLQTELNPILNLKRSLFAVWQEYQGVGLLGGMGHAAALPRDILVFFLSLFLRQSIIRLLLTFLMLYLGGVGTYLLSFDLIKKRFNTLGIPHMIALFAGVFAIVSPLTQQMFAVPFEAFTIHFAALPLLIWSVTRVLTNPSKRHVILFFILNLLFATQAYIPTLFITYSLILCVVLFTYLAIHRTFHSLKTVFFIGITTLLLNAYWLMPFLYFTATQSSITVNAKINQMSTGNIFSHNKAYGTLHNIILGQSFWIDTFDLNPQESKIVPIEQYWLTVRDRNDYVIIGYALFGVMIFGGFGVITKRRKEAVFTIPVFLLCLTMLATDTPPFSLIGQALRNAIPLFNQAFRFPFTKWGLATVWSMSLLLSLGIAEFISWKKFSVLAKTALVFLIFLPLAWYFYPLLTNKLFYPAIQVTVPNDYAKLYSYLKSKPNGRIANIPQYTYWGWSYYRWGYTGSGFVWYGIEQPILDRAFDVWSQENENYFWEISYALYAKNSTLLANVLNKYDIQYILFDRSVISPSHNRALFEQNENPIFDQLSQYRIDQQFGNLVLLERKSPMSNTFISLRNQLPAVVTTDRWMDYDAAFSQYGWYTDATTNNNSIYYPFRSAFTKRSVEERQISIAEHFDSISLESHPIPEQLRNSEIVYATDKMASESAVRFINTKATVEISKDKTLVYDSVKSENLLPKNVTQCGSFERGISSAKQLVETSNPFLHFEAQDQKNCLSFVVSSLSHVNGYLVKVVSRNVSGQSLQFSLVNQTAKHTEEETFLPQSPEWKTSWLILPPLAFDGLGYNVYITNESIGREKSINDLSQVQIYQIPYSDLVETHVQQGNILQNNAAVIPSQINHPNPSYYSFTLNNVNITETLLLSQSFHKGWHAYEVNSSLGKMFPFLFGKEIKNHVMVNNWANGWTIQSEDERLKSEDQNENTIVIFFTPQLLEWVGFVLLPFPFFFLIGKRVKNK